MVQISSWISRRPFRFIGFQVLKLIFLSVLGSLFNLSPQFKSVLACFGQGPCVILKSSSALSMSTSTIIIYNNTAKNRKRNYHCRCNIYIYVYMYDIENERQCGGRMGWLVVSGGVRSRLEPPKANDQRHWANPCAAPRRCLRCQPEASHGQL